MKQTVQFNVRLSAEELQAVREVAQAQGISVNRLFIESALNGVILGDATSPKKARTQPAPKPWQPYDKKAAAK